MLAVQAFAQARHRAPGEAKLLLFGGGPEQDRAQKVAAETGAIPQVEFAGPMSREHVVQVFRPGRLMSSRAALDLFLIAS